MSEGILASGSEAAGRPQASTASTRGANCLFAAGTIRSMMLALAERMPPASSLLVQFTGCAAAQSRRPAGAWHIGGAISLKEPAMEENQAAKKPPNKTEILAALSETTGLTKQQVGGLLDELCKLIGKNLGSDGPGAFALPGLLQIKVVRKPATEEHKGVNPFTKEEMVFKAKPAKNVVKIIALKGLKDMV
jgi:nucleoid DNA-binding protein